MMHPYPLLLSLMVVAPVISLAQEHLPIHSSQTPHVKRSGSLKCLEWNSSASIALRNRSPAYPNMEFLIPTELKISPAQDSQDHRLSAADLFFYSENRSFPGKYFRWKPRPSRESKLGPMADPSFRLGGEGIKLSTLGLDRYFFFIPETASWPVPARVLDLRWTPARTGFYLIVEWISESDGFITNSVSGSKFKASPGLRQIQLLSERELLQIPKIGVEEKRKIEQFFDRDLSSEAIRAKALAQRNQLRSFIFSDFSPLPPSPASVINTAIRQGDGGGFGASATDEAWSRIEDSIERDFPNPLREMNDYLRFAIEHSFIKRFGSLKALWTSDERINPQANLLDAMGRLHPRSVLSHFESKGEGYRYMFVITEDGHLKISPFAEKSFSFRPPLMRLSHARQIYAGGTFSISSGGELHLALDSRFLAPLAMSSELDGSSIQGKSQEPKVLIEFVTKVFLEQSDRRIVLSSFF